MKMLSINIRGCMGFVCAVVLSTLTACTPNNIPDIPGGTDTIPTDKTSRAVLKPAKSEKRGVSFNFSMPEDVFLLRSFVSWSYNWGPNEDDDVAPYMDMTDITFFPMAWTANFNEGQIAQWIQSHPNTKYILGFNEPNLTDQCNMTPSQVAESWPRLKHLADSLNVSLVSPAMNYGTLPGYSDPIKWLDEFFTYIPIEQSGIKVIAIHCYMNTAAAVKSYIERFYKYNLPIWMTEFCAWDGGVAGQTGQMDYMADIVSFMELNPKIERYAWFIPRSNKKVDEMPYNQLITHTMPAELTTLGKLYAALPNLAEPQLHMAEAMWDLTKFYACRQEESLNNDGLYPAPHFRISNDTVENSPEWMIYNMMQGQWVEYAVQADQTHEQLCIRYQSTGSPLISLQIDENKPYLIVLPTTSEWTTHYVEYPLKQGKHFVRFTMEQGFCNISTIYWN